MAFNDKFRLSAHAVILDDSQRVLMLKATYAARSWGLPGGAFEPGETVHECVVRECEEELGQTITVQYLSGVYYHKAYDSQVFILRCALPRPNEITLGLEHSEYRFFSFNELSTVQLQRVKDCVSYNGYVRSARF